MCITAPCPSSREVQFTITEVSAGIHDGTRYEATEVLTNIPSNVRIAPRKLEVTESSTELVAPGGRGFMRRETWQVRVKPFNGGSKYYSGNPKRVVALE